MASSSTSATTNAVVDFQNQLPIPPPVQQPLPFQFLCRVAILAILVFLLTISFIIIIWFIFHPTFPQLTILTASVSRLAAECNATLSISNTNRHLSVIYERMEVSLIYPSQSVLLSQFYGTPFVQPARNCTRIEIGFKFSDILLGSNVVKALKKDVGSGNLRLGVKIVGIVTYRYRNWAMQTQFLRAYCGDLVFGFTGSSGGVLNVGTRDCQVYLYTQ